MKVKEKQSHGILVMIL